MTPLARRGVESGQSMAGHRNARVSAIVISSRNSGGHQDLAASLGQRVTSAGGRGEAWGVAATGGGRQTTGQSWPKSALLPQEDERLGGGGGCGGGGHRAVGRRRKGGPRDCVRSWAGLGQMQARRRTSTTHDANTTTTLHGHRQSGRIHDTLTHRPYTHGRLWQDPTPPQSMPVNHPTLAWRILSLLPPLLTTTTTIMSQRVIAPRLPASEEWPEFVRDDGERL